MLKLHCFDLYLQQIELVDFEHNTAVLPNGDELYKPKQFSRSILVANVTRMSLTLSLIHI